MIWAIPKMNPQNQINSNPQANTSWRAIHRSACLVVLDHVPLAVFQKSRRPQIQKLKVVLIFWSIIMFYSHKSLKVILIFWSIITFSISMDRLSDQGAFLWTLRFIIQSIVWGKQFNSFNLASVSPFLLFHVCFSKDLLQYCKYFKCLDVVFF